MLGDLIAHVVQLEERHNSTPSVTMCLLFKAQDLRLRL